MTLQHKLLLQKQLHCHATIPPARKHHVRLTAHSKGNINSSGIPSEDFARDELQQPIQPNDQRQRQQQEQEPEQQQQETNPPGFDPKAAAGFMPTPGDKPLWWVEKFEGRRRKLAEQSATGSNSNNASANSSSSRSSSSNPTFKRIQKAGLQLLQLAVVIAALILWPASLYPGGLAVKNVWLCYVCYMLFFGGGSVYRLVKFGRLTSRKQDRQAKTWLSTVSWAMFVMAMPIIHWAPVVGLLKRQQQQQPALAATAAAAKGSSYNSYLTVYDVIGVVMLMGATALNWWAATHLGKAYDRVVQPDALITTGPYAFVQHPIYSSYMLLFAGYSMMMHSAATAVLALAVCLVYYMSRTGLEKDVLHRAFGQKYEAYASRTKLFIPGIL